MDVREVISATCVLCANFILSCCVCGERKFHCPKRFLWLPSILFAHYVISFSFLLLSFFLNRATDSQGANESHEDLTSVLYNSTFNQVVMVKSLGLVKIYQAEVSY